MHQRKSNKGEQINKEKEVIEKEQTGIFFSCPEKVEFTTVTFKRDRKDKLKLGVDYTIQDLED